MRIRKRPEGLIFLNISETTWKMSERENFHLFREFAQFSFTQKIQCPVIKCRFDQEKQWRRVNS